VTIGVFRNPSQVGLFMNYKYVTVSYADVQNPNYSAKVWFEVPEQNYIPDFYFQTTKIVPGQYYPYTIELDPYDYVFNAGSQIGLMVFGTDPDYSQLYDECCIPEFDIKIGPESYAVLPMIMNEPDAPATIEADNAWVSLGDTVEITYSIKDNGFGFSALALDLPFNSSIFTPVDVKAAGLIDGADFTYAIGAKVLKVDIAAEDNIAGDDILFIVTYKINEKAPYIFYVPLNITVTEAKFGSFMDKLVDLQVNESAGFLATKLVDLLPKAFVTKLNGNKNNLTITVTETYVDGTVEVYTKTFSIDNNAAGTYMVGDYTVYVDTKGNDQIRACYVIEKADLPLNNSNNQGSNGNGQGNNGNSQGNNGNSQGNNGKGNQQ